MLILELVQGLQTIRCLGLRAVRCRVYNGEAEASYLYNTQGIKLHCETNIGLFLPWKREEVKFHYALWGTDLPQVSEGEFTY